MPHTIAPSQSAHGAAPHLTSGITLPVPGYTRPLQFFVLATAIPWTLWFAAAWASRQGEAWLVPGTVLAALGLAAPLGVAIWMSRHDPALRHDMLRRLIDFRGVHWYWIALACGLMSASIFVATLISLPLGYSPEQFLLRDAITFSAGAMPAWLVLVGAPILEELAWHSYGTDALRSRFSVFWTSIVFAAFWAAWHIPLSMIEGSSQNETVDQGILQALNFPLSIFPFVILMNWIYYRTGRNITLVIAFHLSANLASQVVAVHADTELIQTAILLVVMAVVLVADRKLFFDRPERRLTAPA